MEAIVGVDIGTTNIKVMAFSTQGEPLAAYNRKNNIYEDQPKQYDFDGQYIFDSVLEMLRELVEKGVKIASIGISSFAETVFPVFSESNSIRRTMAWYDLRTQNNMERFVVKICDKEFYHITGLQIRSLYSIFKVGWYYENLNEIFNAATKWLPANSYLGYLLTGSAYIDYSMASRTGALDLANRRWSDKIFSLLPFNQEIFPDFIDSGQCIGLLKREYKEFLGINYDVPVSLGGHDHICGNYAVAAYQGENIVVDSMGTAENIQAIIDRQNIDLVAFATQNIFTGLHVIPSKAYIYKAFHYSGGLINSLMSMFFNKPSEKFKEDDFKRFIREANEFVNQPTLIDFYIEDNNDKRFDDLLQSLCGINILNISSKTKRGEIFMASMRYLAKKSKEIIYTIEEIIGNRAEVVMIGGSIRNRLFMSEKAKIIKRNMYLNSMEEAVTLGAALLGGVGANVFKNYEDAVKNLTRQKVRV
jgi:xylulokinase